MKYNFKDYEDCKIYNVLPIKPLANGKWEFLCECGKTFSCYPSRVISGHKKSCGCTRWEHNKTHGKGNSEYYHGWWSMMQRCYNPDHHNYKRYGGRGILVCKDWQNPATFIEWAEKTNGKQRNGLTLDRIDNNKGYSPENCKWSTPKEQSRNRNITKIVCLNGESKPLSEWLEIYGVDRRIYHTRVYALGWSIEQAIVTKVKSKQ